jgi:hypothetical protein
VNRGLSGILLALFVSPAIRSSFGSPSVLRLLSFACNGKLRSFVFFVDFSSSFLRYLLVICMLLLQTWCLIFLSIFFGVECNKIFPYFGFF